MAAEPRLGNYRILRSLHVRCLMCANDRWLDDLALPLMVAINTEPMRTAYTVTVDAAEGTTTGISASDRSRTLNLLASPSSEPHDFVRPAMSCLFDIDRVAFWRAGHTEAAVDLAASWMRTRWSSG